MSRRSQCQHPARQHRLRTGFAPSTATAFDVVTRRERRRSSSAASASSSTDRRRRGRAYVGAPRGAQHRHRGRRQRRRADRGDGCHVLGAARGPRPGDLLDVRGPGRQPDPGPADDAGVPRQALRRSLRGPRPPPVDGRGRPPVHPRPTARVGVWTARIAATYAGSSSAVTGRTAVRRAGRRTPAYSAVGRPAAARPAAQALVGWRASGAGGTVGQRGVRSTDAR